MHNLSQVFDDLVRLNAYRDRATTLRNKGFKGLNAISHMRLDASRKKASVVIHEVRKLGSLQKWLAMGNKLEAALLLMVQRDPRLTGTPSSNEDKTPPARRKHDELDLVPEKEIAQIQISYLLPAVDEGPAEAEDDYKKLDRRIPILLAANALQVLTRQASTALSAQSMYCYYAVLQEFHLADRPDWIIGAARAGKGGNVSVFVTGECMRAVRAMEHLHERTAQFLADTRVLYEKYLTLRRLIDSITPEVKKGAGTEREELAPDHPLQRWAEKAIERMWLDWYVSVRRIGDVCFPLPPEPERLTLLAVRDYLQALFAHLRSGIDEIVNQTLIAHADINEYLGKQRHEPEWPTGAHRYAREYAEQIIQDAVIQARKLAETAHEFPDVPDDRKNIRTIKKLEDHFAAIAMSIRRVLKPSERYVEGALKRALADAETQLDAGELVFAACVYGDATNWHPRSRQLLQRACAIVLKSVPEDGMLSTRHPFHSTPRGYKLFPTACEALRSLAMLIEKTQYPMDKTAISAIGRILDAVDNRKLDPANEAWYGWNFEGATEQHLPAVWVSCVTVLSLDRLIQMLDSRINAIVLENFDTVQPSTGLNDLIYVDYALALSCPSFDGRTQRAPMAIRLAEMRAHLMRVPLPDAASRLPAYSAVLYGPPQTGKTTLAEALACSSKVPLVRLSSFDLASDPGESIESRGRVVFDALSMLTNTVILFDEFESVLPDREENHERSLEFLLTGLLPKLVKLHDLAQSQGLVYFLATNHVERIDPAAIRRGRFDLQLPIYNPDALSRAAAGIYRLHLCISRLKNRKGAPEWTRENWSLDAHTVLRLLNIVAATVGAPPTDLATVFFPNQISLDTLATTAPYFAYVLESMGKPPSLPDPKDEPERPAVTNWDREQVWLRRYEQLFQRRLREAMQLFSGKAENVPSPSEILKICLQLPPPPTSD